MGAGTICWPGGQVRLGCAPVQKCKGSSCVAAAGGADCSAPLFVHQLAPAAVCMHCWSANGGAVMPQELLVPGQMEQLAAELASTQRALELARPQRQPQPQAQQPLGTTAGGGGGISRGMGAGGVATSGNWCAMHSAQSSSAVLKAWRHLNASPSPPLLFTCLQARARRQRGRHLPGPLARPPRR